MKFDTSKWQEFELGKLFDIQCSKYHNPKDYEDGNIPYVARTTFNNGIVKKIATDEKLYPANCIIIGAESAMAFYQTKEFLTGNKIYRLYLNDNYTHVLNANLALFFCALINNLGKKYTYTNAFVSNKIEKEKILLPISSKDKPDWEFMENYIKQSKKDIEKLLKIYGMLNSKVSNGGGVKPTRSSFTHSFSSLTQEERIFIQGAIMQIAQSLLKDLNCEWGQFKIGELFSVKSNPQLNKNSFEFVENGEYPYFTRTVYNNGILGYVKYLDEEHKIKGNSIAVGLIAMHFFYMEKDFYAGQFTKTIYPKFKGFNKYIALFFTALFNANKKQYLKNFIVKDFKKDFLNTTISLPINSKKEPDFALMQNFIQNLTQEHTQKLISYYRFLQTNGGGGKL